jgi:sugar/nucleoside kinase (ribokinase family)
VVFSDFRHGIFNHVTTPILTAAIPCSVFRVADSQVASRWGNITEFKGFDLITPNEREARFALADQDSTVGSLASLVMKETVCGVLMLKLGSRGVFVLSSTKGDESAQAYFSIDSFAENVVDAVGAGDALLAYSTLAMLATKNQTIAALLGSLAASCECEIDGNVPITPADVLRRIDALETSVTYNH